MKKQNLSILLIDRPLNGDENVVKDIFMKYSPTYDFIVFPPKSGDEESLIQVVFFEYNLIEEIETLFPSVQIEYDPDDLEAFFDFDITDIEEGVFYEVLEQRYSISIKKLSEVETKTA